MEIQVKAILRVLELAAANYLGKLAASSEIEEIAWFTYAEKHKLVGVDVLIFDYLKEKEFII